MQETNDERVNIIMNREESRKLKKQGVSDYSIRLMEQDRAYKRGLEKGFKDGMSEAVDIMFYMTAYTLNYKLEFGIEFLVIKPET